MLRRRRARRTSRCCRRRREPRARRAISSARSCMPGANRIVLHERDRQALRGRRRPATATACWSKSSPSSARARASRRGASTSGGPAQPGPTREWTIADEERLSSVENIYRLSLNATKAFTARNLKIAAEDLDLTLPEGSVFVGDIDERRHRRGADRPRHAQLPPGAGDRKRPGQDLLRQRDARDAVRRRVPPHQPGRLRRRSSTSRRCSRRRSTRASCAARRKSSARSRRSRSSSTSAI